MTIKLAHKNSLRLTCIPIAFSGMISFAPSAAEAKSSLPIAFEIGAGVEHDSNVSVDEIDQNTKESDSLVVLDLSVELESDLSENTSISVGYDLSQNWHSEFSAFDTQTHRGTAAIDHDWGPVSTGLSYIVARSNLDGAGFLTLQRVTPSLSGPLGESIYLRGSYDYTDKEFDNRPGRDATSHAGGITAFFFLDGTKTFLSSGYKYKDEDAVDPIYDYESHTYRLKFSHDFELANRTLDFSIGWRYEDRKYASTDPTIGEERHDERHRLSAALEIPVGETFFVELEYGYDDYTSNLDTADYSQNTAALRLGARF